METKTLEQQLGELKAGLETFTKEQLQKEIKSLQESITALGDKAEKKDVEALQTTLNEIKSATDKLGEWQVKTDESYKKDREFIDKMAAERKRKPFGAAGTEVKSFNEILGEAIETNSDKIKGYRSGDDIRIDLMPEVKEVNKETGKREVKAVGDMSITGNFPNSTALYQEIRPLVESPYNRVWLGDVLPNGTSNGSQLVYPKENGQTGGVGVWEDPTQDKAKISWNLTSETVKFKWLAGIVIVDRDMLDDISFLIGYIQSKMLISLKTAENAFILNGTATNDIPGLNDVASPYNGSETDIVKRLIDAAWGQIVDATKQFYQPTNIILTPRDAVKVGLHQASGSGEFDLPAGSLAFVNGKLQIGGLEVVTVSSDSFPSDTFLALDKSATMFVKRMQPELRIFDGDAQLAAKNQLMLRIEERATLVVFNNAAIVKGVLQLS